MHPTHKKRAAGASQVVGEHLPRNDNALSSNPSTTKKKKKEEGG
jgi:hypothetical protein